MSDVVLERQPSAAVLTLTEACSAAPATASERCLVCSAVWDMWAAVAFMVTAAALNDSTMRLILGAVNK
jgi:hypothetical protein